LLLSSTIINNTDISGILIKSLKYISILAFLPLFYSTIYLK
jgi:hypothetical protein